MQPPPSLLMPVWVPGPRQPCAATYRHLSHTTKLWAREALRGGGGGLPRDKNLRREVRQNLPGSPAGTLGTQMQDVQNANPGRGNVGSGSTCPLEFGLNLVCYPTTLCCDLLYFCTCCFIMPFCLNKSCWIFIFLNSSFQKMSFWFC